MKRRFNMIAGMALLLMSVGLFLALRGQHGSAGIFIMTGILGWWSANKLSDLEERLEKLETQETHSSSNAAQPSTRSASVG